MDLSRLLVHPAALGDAPARARQLNFALGHLGGAGVTVALVLFVASRIVPLPLALALVTVWLVLSPVVIAFLPRLTGSLEIAQAASVANLSLLAFALSFCTGGLASPLVPWFVLVPFEAALSGRRRLIVGSVVLTGAFIAGLAYLQIEGLVLVTVPVDENLTPLMQAAGLAAAVLYAAFAAASSQSAHRALTNAARQEKERYRVLAEYAMDLIMRFGTDGRITFASPAAWDLLGKTPDDLVGHSISEFVTGSSRAHVQAALSRTSYFGFESILEFRMRTEKGPGIWVEMRCRPLLGTNVDQAKEADAPASAFETVAIIRDITVRKTGEIALATAKDEAEAANEAKSRFLANMSHELRTPLNAIIGFSEMMMAELFGPLGNPRYAEYVTHVRDSGEHLRDVINDVLDMSKVEAGRFELELEAVSVALAMEDALQTVSVTAKKRKVRLDVDLPSGLPRLRADKRAVKQMLLNLLANAIKFTPEAGTVTAAARVEGGSMILEVRDTGIGIAKDALAALGNPFEQVARPSPDGLAFTEPGTGLGLALVKAFAGLHGGAMELESTEGAGTTVRVRLPLAGPSEKVATEAREVA